MIDNCMNENTVPWINGLSSQEAVKVFRKCCGASIWCEQMSSNRPYADSAALLDRANAVFESLSSDDWLEAFECHPKIGDLESLRMKYPGNREWSAGEQAGVTDACEQTLQRLAEGNSDYLDRFGYLFIVCATGKSAAEMLSLLESRLQNTPEEELPIAAAEQRKITQLRLARMLPQDEIESK